VREKLFSLVTTRADWRLPLELPLPVPQGQAHPIWPPARSASERIRDALRRWLEEEL
jgi:hypothetical protein